MNLFQRSFRRVNLTPGERATIKLVKYIGYAVILNLFYLAIPYVTADHINWTALGTSAVSMALLIIVLVLDKYFAAQGDKPLADAAKAGEVAIEQRTHIDPASIQIPALPTDLFNPVVPADPAQSQPIKSQQEQQQL